MIAYLKGDRKNSSLKFLPKYFDNRIVMRHKTIATQSKSVPLAPSIAKLVRMRNDLGPLPKMVRDFSVAQALLTILIQLKAIQIPKILPLLTILINKPRALQSALKEYPYEATIRSYLVSQDLIAIDDPRSILDILKAVKEYVKDIEKSEKIHDQHELEMRILEELNNLLKCPNGPFEWGPIQKTILKLASKFSKNPFPFTPLFSSTVTLFYSMLKGPDGLVSEETPLIKLTYFCKKPLCFDKYIRVLCQQAEQLPTECPNVEILARMIYLDPSCVSFFIMACQNPSLCRDVLDRYAEMKGDEARNLRKEIEEKGRIPPLSLDTEGFIRQSLRALFTLRHYDISILEYATHNNCREVISYLFQRIQIFDRTLLAQDPHFIGNALLTAIVLENKEAFNVLYEGLNTLEPVFVQSVLRLEASGKTIIQHAQDVHFLE